MADMKIYQEVELSLTENLVPTVVHVKQSSRRAPSSAARGPGRMAISSSTARRQRRSWCLSKKIPSSLPSRIS